MMLVLQQHFLRCPFTSPSHLASSFPSLRPTSIVTVHRRNIRSHLQTGSEPLLAELPEPSTIPQDQDGPIQLPPSSSSSTPIFSSSEEPTTLQVATSILLTGAISVFLFRSLRRRAKRSKEMKFRSTGAKKKDLKDEALDSLKAMQSVSINPSSPPSPVQALLGGLSAGVIAIVLYKFTTTIEAALNRQSISDNFSVRQITITIRTIVNGLCYLATFAFGVNAVGLVLYSGQLAINSLMGTSSSNATSTKDNEQLNVSSVSTNAPVDNAEPNDETKQQSSNEAQ